MRLPDVDFVLAISDADFALMRLVKLLWSFLFGGNPEDNGEVKTKDDGTGALLVSDPFISSGKYLCR